MTAKKKKREIRSYTLIGQRMSELGTQVQLARELGLSQQTVSKKLRGECSILLSDLETLAKKKRVRIGWFFEDLPKNAWPSDRV